MSTDSTLEQFNTGSLNLFHGVPSKNMNNSFFNFIWKCHIGRTTLIRSWNKMLSNGRLCIILCLWYLGLQFTSNIITHVVNTKPKLSYWLIDDLVNDQIILEPDTDLANDKLALESERLAVINDKVNIYLSKVVIHPSNWLNHLISYWLSWTYWG